MPSQSVQAFKVLLNCLAPRFKAKGFVRRGSAFVKEIAGNQSVVDFQRNPRSQEEGKYSFFVNLAYLSRLIYWFETGHSSLPSHPSDYHYWDRLGSLVPDLAPWGWFIATEDEAVAMAEGFLEMLDAYGIPWLEEHSSDQALIEAFSRSLDSGLEGDIGPLLRLSVLATAGGNQDLANRAIAKLVERCEGEPCAGRVQAHREKLAHWRF